VKREFEAPLHRKTLTHRFRRSSRFGIEAGAYDQRLIYPIISIPTESQ